MKRASERHQQRLLECLGDPAKEPRRISTIDHAVIVGKRERQHQSWLERGAGPGRLLRAARDTEDRDLWPIDDRREGGAADATEVGDRHARALHFVERELAGAGLLRELLQLD